MKRRNRRKKRFKIILALLVIILVAGTTFVINGFVKGKENIADAGKNNGQNVEDNNPIVNPKPPQEPEKKPDTTLSIAATGDIMFHPSQIEGAYDTATGTYDFRNSFKLVKGILEEADIAIANFEGTTAGDQIYAYQGYPLFNAPDEALDAIKEAGFDILSTANNHSLDTRKAGIIRTVEEINARGMDSLGTYVEKPENRVLIKEVKGIKLAFTAYTEMVNGLESTMTAEDLDAMVNIIDERKIKEDIAYAKEQNADVIIACMHWGNEYSREQNTIQEALADMMFQEGVDIILGSHPHVIQQAKLVEYEGETKFVAYSMGNFLSNQRIETLTPYGMSESVTKYTEDGIIINIEIEKKGETGEVSIKNITYNPIWVYKGRTEDGRTEHVIYPIMEYMENEMIDEESRSRMTRSYRDTMAQMNAE